jgi:hypothetical protein
MHKHSLVECYKKHSNSRNKKLILRHVKFVILIYNKEAQLCVKLR